MYKRSMARTRKDKGVTALLLNVTEKGREQEADKTGFWYLSDKISHLAFLCELKKNRESPKYSPRSKILWFYKTNQAVSR